MSSEQPSSNVVYCPNCLQAVPQWMPVQPLYTLRDAMVYLVVPTMGAMYTALWRYKHLLRPPQYAYDSDGRRHRMLTVGDIRGLREHKKLSFKGAMKWMLRCRE